MKCNKNTCCMACLLEVAVASRTYAVSLVSRVLNRQQMDMLECVADAINIAINLQRNSGMGDSSL